MKFLYSYHYNTSIQGAIVRSLYHASFSHIRILWLEASLYGPRLRTVAARSSIFVFTKHRGIFPIGLVFFGGVTTKRRHVTNGHAPKLWRDTPTACFQFHLTKTAMQSHKNVHYCLSSTTADPMKGPSPVLFVQPAGCARGPLWSFRGYSTHLYNINALFEDLNHRRTSMNSVQLRHSYVTIVVVHSCMWPQSVT